MKVKQYTTSNGSIYQMFESPSGPGEQRFMVRRLPGKKSKTVIMTPDWQEALTFRDTGWGISITWHKPDHAGQTGIHTTTVVTTEEVEVEL